MKSSDSYPQSNLYKVRHTAAHVLALAAKQWDPEVKFAIGPPIENGFYYDFEFSKPINDEVLLKLEDTMAEIIKKNIPVEHKQLPLKQALKEATEAGQDYKAELIEDINEPELGFYGIGDFWDLCKGPHITSTGEIPAFKLLSTAGAYWRGDEHRPMLTRIYGTAFESKKELEKYLAEVEEAKKRDHRKLGAQLGIFTILPEIGSGLPVWLPRGATLYRLLQDYLLGLEIEAGYQHVITSPLGRSKLYETSGHLDHYQDSMYPPLQLDDETFYLRPMNCPHHIALFKNSLHSYKELPVRLAEFGEVFRLEKSGELSGLQRVRGFTINDAHIFCRPDQIKAEIKAAVSLIQHVYKKLELKDYWFRLSLHDEKNKAKYGGAISLWEKSEKVLREAMEELKADFVEAKDEAAFYGPKLDVQMKNVNGKEETVSTVQLDFYLPDRFKLEYIDESGKKQTPVMIHRAVLGSMERFIGIYIEKTAGEFPLWLAPVQAKVLPLSEKFEKYARSVANELRSRGGRVEVDSTSETLGKKIRNAELEKIPNILIVGEKEATDQTITVRVRHTAQQSVLTVDQFASSLT